jgi:hypothetical protein
VERAAPALQPEHLRGPHVRGEEAAKHAAWLGTPARQPLFLRFLHVLKILAWLVCGLANSLGISAFRSDMADAMRNLLGTLKMSVLPSYVAVSTEQLLLGGQQHMGKGDQRFTVMNSPNAEVKYMMPKALPRLSGAL